MKDCNGRDALDCLLSPRSIAIIGVSSDFNKLNGRVMKFLLEKGYNGKIFPVNPKYEEVGGHRCFAAIGDIGEAPELAVISVPAKVVPEQLEAAGKAGVRAVIVFSSGFGEMGEEGLEKERQVVEIARRHGMRLCGPNTLGVINAFEGAFATFTQYGMGSTNPGPVGFVTQSGAFGTAIAALARNKWAIRQAITKQMSVKHSPDIRFLLDDMFDRMDETNRLFAQEDVRRDLAADHDDAGED